MPSKKANYRSHKRGTDKADMAAARDQYTVEKGGKPPLKSAGSKKVNAAAKRKDARAEAEYKLASGRKGYESAKAKKK